MTFKNEHCRVEVIFDEPERTFRDADMISGAVRFTAIGQSLSIHCQPKVGLGVEVYGSETARRLEDVTEVPLQVVSSEAGEDDAGGSASVYRIGVLMRDEPYDPDAEQPQPLVVEAGETGEIRFSERVGDDVPGFRGEMFGCRPAVVAMFSMGVGSDDEGHPVDWTAGDCWAPIQLVGNSSGDSEEQLGERAAELQQQLQDLIKSTQEWSLGRLLKWSCILLAPMLAVIPMLNPGHDPGKSVIDFASMFVFCLGLICPSWIGAGMLLVLVRRWFRNMKPDRGRSSDPAMGAHAVYLLDGRDRLLYFVYWDPRRTKAEPRLRLCLEFRESCLADPETGEPQLVRSRPITELELSLADSASIDGGLLMTGTVPFSDELPAMLLPHRPGWSASDQMWEMDVFAGVHARLETVEGQDLEAIEQVFLSTQSLENQ
jgi:hypothetical protein